MLSVLRKINVLEKAKTASVNLKHILHDKQDRSGKTRVQERVTAATPADRERFVAKLKERDELLNHPSVKASVVKYLNKVRGHAPGGFYKDEEFGAWTPHSVATRVRKGSLVTEKPLNRVHTATIFSDKMVGNEHYPRTRPGGSRDGPSDWQTTRITDSYLDSLRAKLAKK